MAGGLAGELRSHRKVFPDLIELFNSLEAVNGEKNPPFRLIAEPTSPVFEGNVARIGLLGGDLAERVAYLYEQLRAFRAGSMTLAVAGEAMEQAEFKGRCARLRSMIRDNEQEADLTIGLLKEAADKDFDWAPQVAWRGINKMWKARRNA